MTPLLDVAHLETQLRRFEHHLFRLETLPAYAVLSDGDAFHRWKAGDLSLSENLRRWLGMLRDDATAGKHRTRVRVLSEGLTDYELYSCHIYAHTENAGEEIRVLHVGEHDMAEDLLTTPGDFWMVDDTEAVQMHYDERGAFVGAEVLDDVLSTARRQSRDLAWGPAEPFPQWWARHPELHGARVA